jgi:hypothetical protein
MIHEDYMPARLHDTAGQGSLLRAYIIGMLGAGILIAVGLIAGTESGWLLHAQTELGQMNLPEVAVVPEGAVPSVLQALTDDVQSIGLTTSSSLQGHAEQLKLGNADSRLHAAARKN